MNEQTQHAKKKFAVGHFLNNDKCVFQDMAGRYLDHIQEIFFSWPELKNARRMAGDPEALKDVIAADMRWARSKGLSLDLLINAMCYGDEAFTPEQHARVTGALADMDRRGILPETVTVISPYLAQIIKREFPKIDIRASVNARVDSIISMEYMAPMFDSYYISRDLQRDLPTLRAFRKWTRDHGKKLCMLANGSCLRNCPFHFFHETLNSHGLDRTVEETKRTGIQPSRCINMYMKKQYEEILRSSWIRPEDLHLYEDEVDVVKLSTRTVPDPERIVRAYCERSYDGNLLRLLDPVYTFFFRPYILDNKRFPSDWAESGIGGKCATSCTHCGRCTEVLSKVLVVDPEFGKAKAADYHFVPRVKHG